MFFLTCFLKKPNFFGLLKKTVLGMGELRHVLFPGSFLSSTYKENKENPNLEITRMVFYMFASILYFFWPREKKVKNGIGGRGWARWSMSWPMFPCVCRCGSKSCMWNIFGNIVCRKQKKTFLANRIYIFSSEFGSK